MRISNFATLEKHKILICFLCILIIGFLLRVYHLGSLRLWGDEMATALRIDRPIGQVIVIRNSCLVPFPPLYYILLHYWAKVFGASEFSLRFPSVVFSMFSIIFIFKLSKELFNQKVGLISALLLSVSLYNIDFSREAKMYTMLWFLGLVSFYFFYKFIRDNKITDLILYIASTVASVYTLYSGFLFIIIQNAAFFLLFFNKKQLKRWLIAQLIIFVLYLPWLPVSIYSAKIWTRWISRQGDYLQFILDLFVAIASIPILIPVKHGIKEAIIILPSILIFISAFFKSSKKRDGDSASFMRNEYLLLAWLLIPVIMLYLIHIFVIPILMARYISFIHIPFIILFSKGLDNYSAKTRYLVLVVLLYMIFSWQLNWYYKSNKLFINNHAANNFLLYPWNNDGLQNQGGH